MLLRALSFAPPELRDAAGVRRLTQAAMGNDLSFANMYLLREKYGTEVAIEGNFLFRYYGGHGRLQGYAFPCGQGDVEAALRRVEEDARVRQRPLVFCLLTEAEKGVLEACRPGMFCFETDPGNADYLYRREDLAELPGTAYHRKRNHIARFEKMYPEARFVPLTWENAEDAWLVAQAWLEGREDVSSLQHENRAIRHALEHVEELQLGGGVVYVQQQPVAMAIASFISPSVVDVHYEKCHPEFREAYPVINRAVARYVSCEYVNREEDLNSPGLRQAKLSYRPVMLLQKFSAHPLSLC